MDYKISPKQNTKFNKTKLPCQICRTCLNLSCFLFQSAVQCLASEPQNLTIQIDLVSTGRKSTCYCFHNWMIYFINTRLVLTIIKVWFGFWRDFKSNFLHLYFSYSNTRHFCCIMQTWQLLSFLDTLSPFWSQTSLTLKLIVTLCYYVFGIYKCA